MIDADDLKAIVMKRLKLYYERSGDFQHIAKFVNAQEKTVIDWIGGQQQPSGERLIRLWYYLRAYGLPSNELDEIPVFNRYLGELFAFGVIDIDEVKKILSVKVNSGAFKNMRGQVPVHPLYTERDLREKYDDLLQIAIASVEYPSARTLTSTSDKPVAPYVAVTPPSETNAQTNSSTASVDLALALQLAKDVQSGLAAVRLVQSEQCPYDLRQQVFDLLGPAPTDLMELTRFNENTHDDVVG